MGLHPCCGGSLRVGTTVIAILHIVRAIVLILCGIGILAYGVILTTSASSPGRGSVVMIDTASDTAGNEQQGRGYRPFRDVLSDLEKKISDFEKPEKDAKYDNIVIDGPMVIMIAVLILLEGFFTLIFAIILSYGASNLCRRKCALWCIVQCIYLLVGIFAFWLELTKMKNENPSNGDNSQKQKLIISGIGIVLNAYCLWVVSKFVQELQKDEESEMRPLTGVLGKGKDQPQVSKA